jgi:hypothetical protein
MSIRISKDFAALQADGNVVAQLSPLGGVLWGSETGIPPVSVSR